MKNLYFLTLISFVFYLNSCALRPQSSAVVHSVEYRTNAPYLVVLSMDGFRWDYPKMYRTPNLDSIAKAGVSAKSLIPCFPSKTFPNHYSIATGLYVENHGIVLNAFTDSLAGDFRLSDRNAVSNGNFYLGEPIWVTAEKQNLRTACFYWPGSEAAIKGVRPDCWMKYDESVSLETRIDSVIQWLSRPVAKRPHLIMWYWQEPDHTGHDKGPFAPETRQMVEHLDSLVGLFFKKLNRLAVADSINLVFTSDHGMGEVKAERSIDLADYLPETWIEKIRGGNPVIMLQPFDSKKDTVWSVLSHIEHLKVYSRSNIPERFHYSKSQRILDYVCVADSSWSIYWKKTNFSDGGTHGYDPANTDMHAIFYGVGPAFKSGFQSASFPNIDLYPLFAQILGLQAAKTDGTLLDVEQLLKTSGN